MAEHEEEESVDDEASVTSAHSLVPQDEWVRADAATNLGKGSFGIVYAALNTSNGKQFAVKEIDLSNFFVELNEEGSVHDNTRRVQRRAEKLTRLRTELEVLCNSRHKHIVAHLGQQISVTKQKLYIFMEYMAGGTMQDILDKYGPMNNRLLLRYGQDVLSGLEFLHDSDIVHRDIKPGNILLKNDGTVKLGDFGAAQIIEHVEEDVPKFKAGTVLYAPPEMHIYHADITPAYDIWSLGVTFHEMATGACVWPDDKTNGGFAVFVSYITRELLKTGLKLDHPLLLQNPRADALSEMLRIMLTLYPKQRAGIDAIRKCKFFALQCPDEPAETDRHDNVILKLSRLDRFSALTATLSFSGAHRGSDAGSITVDARHAKSVGQGTSL
jgi:serine/threonine protein kinase